MGLFLSIIIFNFLFWIDLIPGYGASLNLNEFITRLHGGFVCYFNPSNADIISNKCDQAAIFGILFAFMYTLAHIVNGYLMKYGSANLQTLVNGITPVLIIIFWWLCPEANTFAGGIPQKLQQVLFKLASLPFIIAGIYLFRVEENDKFITNRESATFETDLSVGLLRA